MYVVIGKLENQVIFLYPDGELDHSQIRWDLNYMNTHLLIFSERSNRWYLRIPTSKLKNGHENNSSLVEVINAGFKEVHVYN